ncbi:ATPase, V1/A1 complex, subunit E [Ramicandelaber brevisporus]|nr:ATPase, V1/A1 complex, subunit E [Ramicandelaber brevisporus]
MARPLSDDQVASEMNKMIAFIKQEAVEKAREIRVKADEEYNMELGKLVRSESVAIDNAFSRKVKQVDVQRRIEHSNLVNRAKLQVLVRRQELLDQLFGDAHKQLQTISTQKPEVYEEAVKGLLQQGLLQMLESHVTVVCRPQDVALLRKIVDGGDIQAEYSKATGGRVVNIYIESADGGAVTKNDQAAAGKDTAGGLVLLAQNGRVRINNTLGARLDLFSESALPAVRNALFGPSPNRKFFD